MKVLLDRSVLTAAYLARHQDHASSRGWVEKLLAPGPDSLFLGAHTVAGVYAGLTELPLKERVPPAHALAFVEAVAQRATLLAVPPEATLPLLASLASNGWGGEAVEDALTALVAARAKIDLLLTLDVEGFRRVWPSGAERIRSPREAAL